MLKIIKTTPFIAAIALVVGLAIGWLVAHDGNAPTTAHSPSTSTAAVGGIEPLVGAWRMTELETGEPGNLRETPYSGQIIFDSSGLVSVQARNPDEEAPDTPYTVGGFEAWSGMATVDSESSTFTATVDSAVVRDLIGQKLKRVFNVNGDTLVLTPADPSEGWRVTYHRF